MVATLVVATRAAESTDLVSPALLGFQEMAQARQ